MVNQDNSRAVFRKLLGDRDDFPHRFRRVFVQPGERHRERVDDNQARPRPLNVLKNRLQVRTVCAEVGNATGKEEVVRVALAISECSNATLHARFIFRRDIENGAGFGPHTECWLALRDFVGEKWRDQALTNSGLPENAGDVPACQNAFPQIFARCRRLAFLRREETQAGGL